LKTKFSHFGFGIFGSLLPPLGLFSQNKLFFLSLSQTHLFGQIERHFKNKFDQVPKTPPFPIVKILPHNRPSFAMRRNANFNSTIFEIHKWLAGFFEIHEWLADLLKFTSGWLIHLLCP
jgi:hypothetical protein